MKNNKKFQNGTAIFLAGVFLFSTGCTIGGVHGPSPVWQADDTFGSGGYVGTDVAAAGVDNYLNGLALDAQGRILVTGSSVVGAGDYRMFVGRYTAAGVPDAGFGVNGFVTETAASIGRGVAADSSGRVVVCGYRYNGSDNDVAVWRFDENGAPDTAFDGDGYAVQDVSGGHDEGIALVLDASGRIVVTGYSHNGGDYDMALWRFTAAGGLDTSFNNPAGFVTHDNAAGGHGEDKSYGLALDAAGRLLVVGRSNNGTDSDIAVWRYTAAGALDAAFDGDGYAVYDTGYLDEASGLAVDSAGRIVAAGFFFNPATGGKDALLLRLTSAGGVDASFGDNGTLRFDYAGKDDGFYGAALDSTGLIFLTGFVAGAGGDRDSALWMADGGGSLVSGFGAGGIISDDHGTSDEGVRILVNGDGRVVIGGDVNPGGDRDISLWRYVEK